jgi:hypothetical protein
MMLHQDGSRHERLKGQAPLGLIVTIEDATVAIYSAFLDHNVRSAVDLAGEGSAFTPVLGVAWDEIPCVEEELRLLPDADAANPESPTRPHFVKARVKVHVYPDGSDTLFTDQDASAAMRRKEGSRTMTLSSAPLKSAQPRRTCGHVGDASPRPHPRRRAESEKADI